LVNIGQKYRALYIKTKAHFIVAGDIKSPSKPTVRVKWYKAVMIA